MRLQDWFQQQAGEKPSDMQKMRIYQQFLDKSHKSISYHKVSYYTKVAVFSFGLFLLGGTIFYSMRPSQTDIYQIAKQGDGYTALQQVPGQFAQADFIGEIIYTAGAVKITHNATEVETNNLSANDRVVLTDGAEMHFRIDEHVEAKISGPAEFALEDIGDEGGLKQYVINLISGDYLEIVTLPTPETTRPQVDVAALPQRSRAEISVKAEDFTIEKVDVKGDLDLVISKTEDGKRHVENKGAEVRVKKIVEEKRTYVAVKTNEKVSINGKIEYVYTDVSTKEELLEKVEDTKFAVRYALENADTTNENSASSLLEKDAQPTKKVIQEDTTHFLKTSLSITSLDRYITQMETYRLEGNTDSFAIAFSNLLEKFARLAVLTEVPSMSLVPSENNIANAADWARSLAGNIDAAYYVDPILLQGLYTVAVSLDAMHLVIPQEPKEQEEVTYDAELHEDTGSEPFLTPEEVLEKETVGETFEDMIDTLSNAPKEKTLQAVDDPLIPVQ